MYKPQPQQSAPLHLEGMDEKQEKMFSLLGGTILVTFAVLRRGPISIPAFLAGAGLLFRALKNGNPLSDLIQNDSDRQTVSHNVSVPHETGIHVARSITINRPVEDLYNFWRDPNNLARVFKYVNSVQMVGDNKARWTISIPGGATSEFDAERYTDVPNEVISWRSLPSAEIKNAWSVRFNPAPGGRGTEVHLTVEFTPPGGALGRAVLNMFGEVPAQYFHQYLREFKQIMETGEKPTTEGQTSGRRNEVKQ